MPPLHSLDPSIIDRYLAGEASPSEKAVIDAHRQADPAWAARIDALAAEFARTSSGDWNVDAAWSTLQRRLPASRFPVSGSVGRGSSLARASRLTPLLAAAGLAFAAAGFGAWRYLAHQRGAAAGETRFAHEIVTPNGSRHTVTLSDGSRVTLNAGSRLRWGRDFGSGARDVYLDGEAYFAVTHDEKRPFRVHARNAIAQDIGTRFTVRAYPELAHLEVAVAEGAVSLRRDRADARDSAVVAAGQLGQVDDSGAMRVESNVAVDRWTAWTTGSLVLAGLTLKDAIPQLERWYDATITVTDRRLAERQVTASFHDETLPQALDALSLALGAKWERQGRAITITPARP
jgi:transmembrane sensor